jgi:hypothetical protein
MYFVEALDSSFVAVGQRDDDDVAWSSDDGLTWRRPQLIVRGATVSDTSSSDGVVYVSTAAKDRSRLWEVGRAVREIPLPRELCLSRQVLVRSSHGRLVGFGRGAGTNVWLRVGRRSSRQ